MLFQELKQMQKCFFLSFFLSWSIGSYKQRGYQLVSILFYSIVVYYFYYFYYWVCGLGTPAAGGGIMPCGGKPG